MIVFLDNILLPLINLESALPGFKASISIQELSVIAKQIQIKGGQLLTLWGSEECEKLSDSQSSLSQNKFTLHLVFLFWQQGLLYLQSELKSENPVYPDLSQLFPVANRLQRALYDLLGIKAENASDERPWLRHGAWPMNVFPLRKEIKKTDHFPNLGDHYSFIRVHGKGVHEIPVGPVHAGIIEPGHFRFQVVGERILRLEERLAYTHKGIAKQFQGLTVNQGIQLAGRLSGDSTVAYAWSYSMAIEHLCQIAVPKRCLWLRALLLERERIMNHIGDLGFLGNDAGLSFGLAQFSRLKENLLRLNAELFGSRYLMDTILPGGVNINLTSTGISALQNEIQLLIKEINTLKTIYAKHDGLQDRFLTTGSVTPALAAQLGLLGMPARASGQKKDLRTQLTYPPYHQKELAFQTYIENEGDVAARVRIRFHEIEVSCELIARILMKLPSGDREVKLPSYFNDQNVGIGCVEGWRGPVFIAVACNQNQSIRWAHTHDPSWQNWPALEHAVINNFVADFPLINKSFNLSYSGHDG